MSARPWRLLSSEQVVAMHAKLLDLWGGDEGSGHRGGDFVGVEAAVQAVKNSYYDTADELAACYAIYIVQGHVFLDGNKRTGAAAMLTFLEYNGAEVSLSVRARTVAMLELQVRSERGERTDVLVAWLADLLRSKRAKAKR